ncbi:MAG TPA: tol-pal system-associated acyl-CoA thioesterase [Burkholderiaceae bacterium]|nr:tol-pal system-associated acyl-CoA thioesterase [Burkholderiaceae bacterium]
MSQVAAEGVQRLAARAQAGYLWRVRVYYEDTDAGGVVYYANYLRFFERCRTEWMRALGFGQRELSQRDGVLFVVAGAELQFLRSAVLDDELTIGACLAERHASYVVFDQQAMRGSELLCRARVKVACIGARTMKPTRLPIALVTALSKITQQPAVPADRVNQEN